MMAPAQSRLVAFHLALEESTLEAFDGRHFVLFSRLEKWFNSLEEDEKTTRVEGLLQEAYSKRQFLPLPVERVCREGLAIFSILLEIDRPQQVDRYLSQGFVDSKLPITLNDLRDRFGNGGEDKPNSDAERFDKVQWKYCAPKFHFDTSHDFLHHHVLPFCRLKPINYKGATARLSEIEIPAEFIEETLRSKVQESHYESTEGRGKV